jgi:Kdo2-lipid IVA lauroyltransferase/acyltransferase
MNRSARFWATLISAIAIAIPDSVRRLLAKVFAIVWFDLLRFRRKIILDNLSIAFPEWDDKKKISVGRQCVVQMCEGFFEFFVLPRWDKKWMQENVVFHGLDILKREQAKKKGLLLLSLHLGNGDIAIRMIALQGTPLAVITKRFKSKWLDDFWFMMRGTPDTRFIESHGRTTPFDILKACRENQPVVFVLDQYMGPPYGVETAFFGQNTGTAYGLALFALKTGAPVVTVYTRRDYSSGKIHIHFEGPLAQLEIENKDEYLTKQTQVYNDELERIVRTYPEQWMWIHRRWKKYLSD